MKIRPLAILLLCVGTAQAQQPDRRGEVVTDKPEYRGVRANAPIPPELHIRNEGGSDGAGLCVISSILSNGMYQHVPGLEGGKQSRLWRAAKGRRGGYSPGKLEALLKEVLPGEKWLSVEGDATDVIEAYSRKGYPTAGTMNTGAQYGYMPIHHMIQPIHADSDLVCVVDNNDPGKYHWMPRAEYDRRYPDGRIGWTFIWLRSPARATLALFAAAALLIAAGGLVCLGSLRPNPR